MTTASKTVTKKIDTLHPPTEIREITKARRAWLAERVAEINALPNRSAKIVGTGSYQTVSVYEVKEVEGRLRLRGVCQCCGNEQVVEGEPGRLVLHGYKRPGDGYTVGRCPGVAKAPLNDDDAWTKTWHLNAVEAVEAAQVVLDAAEARLRVAKAATRGDVEPGAYLGAPTRPRTRYGAPLTDEQEAKYADERAAWVSRFPLTAEREAAQEARDAASTKLWNWKQTAKHFETLLTSGIKGTPLTREVV